MQNLKKNTQFSQLTTQLTVWRTSAGAPLLNAILQQNVINLKTLVNALNADSSFALPAKISITFTKDAQH
jgi:hypothetical protein